MIDWHATPTVLFKSSSSSLTMFDRQQHRCNRVYGIAKDMREDEDVNVPSQSRSRENKEQLEEWKLLRRLYVISIKAS
jgi:hypothetical protein